MKLYDRLAKRLNLAPAHIKEGGPSFDFSMAIGNLGLVGILSPSLFEPYAFLGELDLNGELRPIKYRRVQ